VGAIFKDKNVNFTFCSLVHCYKLIIFEDCHRGGWRSFCQQFARLSFFQLDKQWRLLGLAAVGRSVVRQANRQINHYSQNVGHNLRLRFVICREIAQLTGDSPRRIQSDRTSCVVGPATAGQQMPNRPRSVRPSLTTRGQVHRRRRRDHRIIANA